jgi:hypothetical protein
VATLDDLMDKAVALSSTTETKITVYGFYGHCVVRIVIQNVVGTLIIMIIPSGKIHRLRAVSNINLMTKEGNLLTSTP